MAFDGVFQWRALLELEAEGGLRGHTTRYEASYRTLVTGMRELGFEEYVAREDRAYIITSFRHPDDPNFSFRRFYDMLNKRSCVIYPGTVSDAGCFRIGNIGLIGESDVRDLLAAITSVLEEMGVALKPSPCDEKGNHYHMKILCLRELDESVARRFSIWSRPLILPGLSSPTRTKRRVERWSPGWMMRAWSSSPPMS